LEDAAAGVSALHDLPGSARIVFAHLDFSSSG
jgi:hypothetical protein